MSNSKDVVRRFLETFSTGDVDAILGMLTDDATWWVAGRIEGMSGTQPKPALGEILRQVNPLYRGGALKIDPSSMIAEGMQVACEATSHAELHDGRVYENQYHFLFVVSEDRIASVREYSDTQHMLETFSN